ncbi:MAG: hypothetical protein GF308_16825 [Candidatus Heimdallarchaeota archaeon]|nr:hypothetical protein [Candidatus Heimdallarchaeota archaeon]
MVEKKEKCSRKEKKKCGQKITYATFKEAIGAKVITQSWDNKQVRVYRCPCCGIVPFNDKEKKKGKKEKRRTRVMGKGSDLVYLKSEIKKQPPLLLYPRDTKGILQPIKAG